MGKAKYFLEFLNKIKRNVGRSDSDSEDKIFDAFNDAMDIIAMSVEMESLKSTSTVSLYEGIYSYEFSEFDLDDLRHIYTMKINDGTQYYDPMLYVTQQVWDAEVAPYIHTLSSRPTMFTLFDDTFYIAGNPDDDYDLEIRFAYWPEKVIDSTSVVDLANFDSSLLSLSTAFFWLKVEEVELYQEWMRKAAMENKLFKIDAMKVVDFVGKSNVRSHVSVGPTYWADPFRRSAP